LAAARSSLCDSEARLERARGKSKEFWTALDLSDGNEPELRARLERRAEWQKLQRAANASEVSAAGLRAKLSARAFEVEQGREELVRRKQAADGGAAQVRELASRSGDILCRLHGHARQRHHSRLARIARRRHARDRL
jgi:hypothetical protein